MARNMYGATSADFTLTSGGRVVPGATLTIWSARTGGTQITDLLDVDSVATTTVTSDADGSIVYYGPNNDKTVHWADSGVGNRIAVRPTDITGDPPSLSIGTVGTGAAAASLTGTSEAPVLNLTLPAPIGDIDGIGIPTLPAATTPTNLATAGQAFDGGSISGWSGAGGATNTTSTPSAVTGPDGDAMLVSCPGSQALEGVNTTLAGLTAGHTYTVALRLARVSGPDPLKMTAYANGTACQAWIPLAGTAQGVLAIVFVATGTTATFAVSIAAAAGGAASFRVDAVGYWEGAGGSIPAYGATTTTGLTATDSGVIGTDGSHAQYQITSYTNQHIHWRSAAGAIVQLSGDDLHTAYLAGFGWIGGNHASGASTSVTANFTGASGSASKTWTWVDAAIGTQVQTWQYRADQPGVVLVDTQWTFHAAGTIDHINAQAYNAVGTAYHAAVGVTPNSPLVTWVAGADRTVPPAMWANGIAPTCFMSRGDAGSSAIITLGDKTLNNDVAMTTATKGYLYEASGIAVVNGTVVNTRAAHSWSPHAHDRALHVVRDGAVVRWWLMAGSTGDTTHPSLPYYEGAVVVQTRGTAAVTTEVVSGAITVTGAGWAEGVIRTDI